MKMVNWMQHSRRVARHIGRRVLSGLLALVMTLGLVELALPARAAPSVDVEQTGFTVVHHHLDDGETVYSGTIDPDGRVHLHGDEDEHTAPYVVRPEPKRDDDGNELESFSGFTVEKGDAAVAINADDPETAGAEISYEPGTPQVTLHVYYQYNDDPGEGSPSSAPSEAPGLPDGQDDPADAGDDIAPPQETDAPEAEEPAPTDDPTAEPEPTEAPADESAPEDGEPDIEPVSIGDGVTLSAETKAYLAAHAGTYVTEKNYKNGGNTYEGSEWSIVIAESGEDIKLLYNNEDTGAVVTSFGTPNATAGMPGNITFSKEGEWFNNNGTTNQTLAFGWNQYGYITMPNVTVYKSAAEGSVPLYYFSSAVRMYNQTKVQEYFKQLADTYTINDGSGWKIAIGEDSIKMTDGGDDDIFLDYVNFGNTAETYSNVTSLVFSCANWYNNTGATPYQTLTATWSPVVNANTVGKTEGFERYVFTGPNAYIYNQDKTVIKRFVANNMFMPDKIETYSRKYFKDYQGTYEISADYGTYYDPEFKDWKLEIDAAGNVTMQYRTDGTKYPAVLTKALNRSCTNADGTKTDKQYVSTMSVYVPGFYTSDKMTDPSYLTLTWYINETAKNASEGKGAWRFQITAANLYRAVGADGAAELLRTPTIYCDHTEKYIGMAKNFLKNYSGKYYYNYAGTTGEYIQITDEGAVEWYYYNDAEAKLEKRTPVHYNFAAFNINGNNTANNYINGPASMDNPYQVNGMIFADGNWYDTPDRTPANDRRTVTLGFNFENENFTTPSNSTDKGYKIYSAKTDDAQGQLLRYFNEYGVGNGGTDRERYIRFNTVSEFFAAIPKEYPLNDNSGWKITIDENGLPTLTDGKITADNIKIKYVSYTEDKTVYPYKKTGLSSFTFTSSDWYNAAGTQNYQTLSPSWVHYVSASASSSEHPQGFERYAFNTSATLYGSSQGEIIKVFRNNYSMFAAYGGYANEYFMKYQGEYPLGPGFGANYDEVYQGWKIVIDDKGAVSLEIGDNKYQAVLASANRIQKYDAGGNKLNDEFVPSVNQMYVYMPGYYTDTACTTPAYLTLTWNINSAADAKEHCGEPYKYFSAAAVTLYKPAADGEGEAEMFKAPTLYFMHTSYVDWYKGYYQPFAGKYYVNRPGTAEAYADEYIEILEDGTPVYYDFKGTKHEAIYVTRSNDSLFVLGDESVYPLAVQFTQNDWYSNTDNGEKKSAGAAYSFTWAVDQGATFTNARRFYAPNAAIYAPQKQLEDGNWEDKTKTELKHYFTTSVTYTYEGAAGAPADKDKASIAEMKEYLQRFAFIKGGASDEYTEYSFNDPNIDWGIRITKDGDVLVDFDDTKNDFVKVNPRPVFGQSTNTAIGINGRYLSTLLIEVPEHYSDDAATKPAFITLTWPGNSANIVTHYFTANAAELYHKAGSESAHKVVLSSTERFVCDAELDDDRQYMTVFEGEYYANDGSDWGMKITNQGMVEIKFGTKDYVAVTVAPTFTYSDAYGKYVSEIVVPLDGWFANTECTQDASLTLEAHLRQTGANQDYINSYFTIKSGVIVYKPNTEAEGEPKHMTIPTLDFAAEHDYENAKEWLKQTKYTGTYRPQMTDKWYAVIEADGSVYFYVEDPDGVNETNGIEIETVNGKQYRKIRPHITLRAEINDVTHVAGGVSGFTVMFPNARAYQANSSIQYVEQMQKVTFTATTVTNGAVLGDETAYITAANTTLYDAKNDGAAWEVKNSGEEGYNKTFDKLYNLDRAYSDKNKERARNYFKGYAGTYYLDDPSAPGHIEIDTDGNIKWVPENQSLVSDGKMYYADVAFNSDNATLGTDGKHLPKSIYIWYNGYRTAAKDQDEVVNGYTPFQRGDITWSNYNNSAANEQTYHSFAGGATLYADKKGTTAEEPAITINGSNHYLKSDETVPPIVSAGTYETADRQYKIVVATDGGKTSYTFKTPDGEYPLLALGTKDGGYYLRGKIGETIVFGQFYESHGAIISSSVQITYKNKENQNVVIPAGTLFTNYSQTEEDKAGPIVVANGNQTLETGTRYASFAKAMGNVENGGTIYLTDDVAIGNMAEIAGDKTITIDGQNHTISRAVSNGVTYTGSLFKIDAGDNVTFKDVKIDAGAYWDWNNTLVDRDIQISVYGVQLPDGRGGNTNNCYTYGGGKPVTYGARNAESRMLPNEKDMQKLIDEHFGGGKRYEYNPDTSGAAAASLETGEGTNVASTANLIQVGGTVTLIDTEIGYMSTYDAVADKYGGYGVFGVTGKGATINLNNGTDIHHLDTTANALVRGMNETTVNFNGNAQVHEVYASGGNGGLIDMRTNSTVTINDNAELYDVFAYNSNGSVIMDYGGKLEINGGSIHHNAGVGGTDNGHGMTLYIYNNSDFTMNDGEIAYNIGHGTSTIYQQPGSKGMQLNGGSLHDNLRWTQKSVSYGERTDTECDIYVLSDAVFGPDMTVDEDIVVNQRGSAENFGKLTGSVTVLGKQEGDDVTTFKNRGEITGDLYVQNGANAVNEAEGKIDGNVIVEPATADNYGTAGNDYFVNNGEIKGNLTVTNDAKVFNSGKIDANVTVQSGGEIILDGGGDIEGNVTLYPGSELRTNNPNDGKAVVKGKITVEYRDEADKQRLEDILRDSNISATGGIEWKQHIPDGDLITKEATCYEDGYSYIDCKCGDKGNYEVIPATGKHDLALSSNTLATCTEPGRVVYACTTPGCTYQEVTENGAAQGHKPVLDEVNCVPATALTKGVIALKCANGCGWTETEEVPTLSSGFKQHDFETIKPEVTPATCNEEGKYVIECNDCHQKIEIPIPKIPHSHLNTAATEVPDDKLPADSAKPQAPTCANAGFHYEWIVCDVCNQGDESTIVRVTDPATGHAWGGWVIDEANRGSCTNETKQTRECSVCHAKETVTARAKAHNWENGTTCTVCGAVRNGLRIEYYVNGGDAPQSLYGAELMTYAPGTTVTLWQPTGRVEEGITDGKWTKYVAFGNAVFIGWSTVDYGPEPFYNDVPTELELIETIDLADNATEDVQVYAVWALDRNGNGVPDYDDGKATLKYDKNGGTEGNLPDDMTELLIGAAYPLATETNLKKNGAVFAGWSLTATEYVIPATIKNIDSSKPDEFGNPISKVTWTDDGSDKSVDLITSPYTIPTTASGGTVTLYAVYAEPDAEGKKPAFDDNYYHVEYYAPGAINGDRYTVDPDTGWFYTCNDHHAAYSWAALLTTQAASVMIHKEGAVLIGWTNDEAWNNADHALITSAFDEELTLISTVQIPASSNAKVYAVWAVDENGNGIRDYHETQPAEPDPGPGGGSGSGSGSGGGSTVCDGGAKCPSRKYTDVDQSQWYHLGVDYAIVHKLMVGKDDGIFDPDGITTRAEMVTILYRLDGEPAVTKGIKFDDVPAGQWCSDAINWAAANDIVKGYGNGKFGPSDTISREQMAAILYRYASYKGYDMTKLSDLTDYTDAGQVSGWAVTAMRWAVAEDIIEGTSTTTLSPSGDSTRAQVATIFMRFCTGGRRSTGAAN